MSNIIHVPWDEAKLLMDDGVPYRATLSTTPSSKKIYRIYMSDSSLSFVCTLEEEYAAADVTEFETSYKKSSYNRPFLSCIL